MADKRPSLLLLTAGRDVFLEENLLSIQKQTLAPAQVILVNDGKALSDRLIQMAQACSKKVQILCTAHTCSGQWSAFEVGLKAMGAAYPFSIIHDDDRLKPDYVETLTRFAQDRMEPWICSHNLEVFHLNSVGNTLILPNELRPFVLHDKWEACLHYSRSFLPFPGTCFGIPAAVVSKHLKSEFREMADVVLLCGCGQQARIFFEPRPIYEYRRHDQQVSEFMDHAMEDKLQDYLLGSTRGTGVEAQVKRNLEKRRAERFFSWAWESGTFQDYPFRKQFHWIRTLRCVRNRKLLFAKICALDFYKNFQSIRGVSQ